MEKKFNIGDRVRFTRDYDTECVCVDKGDCGTIERVDANNGILITLDNPEYVRIFDTDYIEQIMSNDPKTAFLSELKGLLEKYGAKMSADVSGPDLDCAEIDMLFLIGDDEIRFDVSMFNSFITPDNIIESACYDKD